MNGWFQQGSLHTARNALPSEGVCEWRLAESWKRNSHLAKYCRWKKCKPEWPNCTQNTKDPEAAWSVWAEGEGVEEWHKMEWRMEWRLGYNARRAQSYGETYFQKVFWEQQIKATKSKSTGMRWHPLIIIKWCSYETFASQEQSSYHRSTHCVITLTIWAKKCSKARHVWGEREVCDADEMYVKQDIIYDKNTGELTDARHFYFFFDPPHFTVLPKKLEHIKLNSSPRWEWILQQR